MTKESGFLHISFVKYFQLRPPAGVYPMRRHEKGMTNEEEGLVSLSPGLSLIGREKTMDKQWLLDFLEETVRRAGVADWPRRFCLYQNRIVIAVFPDFFHSDEIP